MNEGITGGFWPVVDWPELETEEEPTSPPSQTEDAAFVGPYRILERVGRGRLGVVYRGHKNPGDSSVAIKFLTGLPIDADGRILQRFHESMATVTSLGHTNIAAMIGHGLDDGVPYLVTEYLDGGNLAQRLSKPVLPKRVLEVASAVADALDYAHAKGAVHGGLDPSAVLFRPNGQAVVTGFGLAKLIWLVPPAKREALLRGLPYLAPEQSAGEPASVRSDVWALAALIYEMLTGRRPYPGGYADQSGPPPAPSSLVAGIPAFADHALVRALSALPDDRPAAAGMLVRSVFARHRDGARTNAVLLRERPEPAAPVRPPEPVAVPAAAIDDGADPDALQPEDDAGESEAQELAVWWQRLSWVSPRYVEVAVGLIGAIVLIAAGYRLLETARQPLTALAVSSMTTGSPPGSWTMLGHNPARTNAAIETAGVIEGKPVWQIALGAPVTAGPVVGSAGVLAGTADGRIVSLDPLSGTMRWEFKTSGAIEAGPALADGLAFVGLRDGRVVALDSVYGGTRWEFRTGGPVTAAPLAADGTLYVASNDGRVYALDAASGVRRWEFDTGSPVSSPPALANGLVLTANRAGKLHILEAATGALRWEYRTGGTTEGSPVLAGGFAYVATDRGILHALDPFERGGLFEWERRSIQAQLYLLGLPVDPPGSQPGYKWSFNAGSPVVGSLAVAGNLVYLPGTDGQLFAVDAMTGERSWSVKQGGPLVAGPIVSGDVLYLASEDGRLAALDAVSGEKLWDVAPGGKLRTSPAIGRGALFVGTDTGKIISIR